VADVSRHKAKLRGKQRQLRALLTQWDPLGVADSVPDEYDCLLPILGHLYRGASERDIAEYIGGQLRDHFGIDAERRDETAFARRVFEWYWAEPLPGSTPPRQ
jgi:hypothetical protein